MVRALWLGSVAEQRVDFWRGHTGNSACGLCVSVGVGPPLAVQPSLHVTDLQDGATPSGTPRQDSGCLMSRAHKGHSAGISLLPSAQSSPTESHLEPSHIAYAPVVTSATV